MNVCLSFKIRRESLRLLKWRGKQIYSLANLCLCGMNGCYVNGKISPTFLLSRRSTIADDIAISCLNHERIGS